MPRLIPYNNPKGMEGGNIVYKYVISTKRIDKVIDECDSERNNRRSRTSPVCFLGLLDISTHGTHDLMSLSEDVVCEQWLAPQRWWHRCTEKKPATSISTRQHTSDRATEASMTLYIQCTLQGQG